MLYTNRILGTLNPRVGEPIGIKLNTYNGPQPEDVEGIVGHVDYSSKCLYIYHNQPSCDGGRPSHLIDQKNWPQEVDGSDYRYSWYLELDEKHDYIHMRARVISTTSNLKRAVEALNYKTLILNHHAIKKLHS
jgi:hypothetical protein